ncbi:unnamed protein product [Trichobilharzia regenti]|nr:unnamed protein product [Trichobilharzia regenti]
MRFANTNQARDSIVQSVNNSGQVPSITWSVTPKSNTTSKLPTKASSHENMEGNSGFFMVEVKLLSDEEVPMQMEVTVSAQ